MRARLVVATALLASVVVGCDGQAARTGNASPTTSGGTQMTDDGEQTPAATHYRAADVGRAIRGVSEVLRSQQLTPRGANAGYSVCEGGEADTFVETKHSYTAKGRADYYIGEAGGAQQARNVVSALESGGWSARDDDWAANGVHAAGGDRWSIYASKDGLSARVEMYATEPVVLMSVSGPCITPPTGKEPSLLSKHVELPGAVPLTNGPTEGENGRLLPGK